MLITTLCAALPPQVLCGSPAEVASQADVVFTMVGFPSDVRHVYIGADGILNSLRKGGIIVDMTTSEPGLAVEIAAAAAARGIHSMGMRTCN